MTSPRHEELSAEEYLEAVRSNMRCYGHETKSRLVRWVSAGGAKLASWQCTICGNSQVVKRSLVKNYDSLPLYDHGVRQRKMESESAEQRAQAEAELEQRRARYAEYIKTDNWKRKRAAVLRRDGNLCQSCLEREATQVHHKTYEHIYNEPLFELVAICVPCHERLTELDRARWARVYGRKP